MNKEYLENLKEKVLKLKKTGEIEKILEHKTLYQRIKETCEEKPDFPAIKYFGNTITYRQLLLLIDNAAKGFNELGVKCNDVITMSMLATPYGIVALYALDKLGATMHMVNSASSIDEIKRELANYKSKMFVATDIFYGKNIREELKKVGIEKVVTTSLTDGFPMGFTTDKLKYQLINKLKGVSKKEFDGKTLISFEQLLNIGRESKKEIQEQKFISDKKVTIAYTSGSTGLSKACSATWEGLDSMIQVMGMTELGRFEPDDVMFTTFPLWIYYSLLNMIIEPLTLGVCIALDPIFDPKEISKRNELYGFNHWLTIPPYIKCMVKENKKIDCSRWKIIITGGAELTNELKIAADNYIKKNNGTTKIQQGYGATEMLGSFSYGYNSNPTIGSVGIPCIGNSVKILDIDTGKPLGINETGVGYLYSPARMKEYDGDIESTGHNLIKDEDGVIWYNTEDLIHQNERGEIFLDGRIRRIALTIDSKGNPTKIIPERTKRNILLMDEVSDCEIITVSDEKVVNKSIAFVKVKSGILETEELRKKIVFHCEKTIPEYMVPKDIIFIREIPLNSSKKPDLIALEQIYLNKNEEKKSLRKRLFKK